MKTTIRKCFQHNFGGIVAVLLSVLIFKNWAPLGALLLILTGSLLLTNICYECLYGIPFVGPEILTYLSTKVAGRSICRFIYGCQSFIPPELLELPSIAKLAVLSGLLIAILFPDLYFVFLSIVTVVGVWYTER